MRIGMLTGGGDCPGLNAVIRAVVRKGMGEYGHTVVGYRHGWRGLIEGQSTDLSLAQVRGLLTRGGTILGT
jgi:6-phosphofructokinase